MSKIIVQAAVATETALQFTVKETIASAVATGQMLVDSDAVSFVYVLDMNEAYTYVLFEQPMWAALKEALQTKKTVQLSDGETVLELQQLHDELSYLVENIEGNANYGEPFVTAVEDAFIVKSE